MRLINRLSSLKKNRDFNNVLFSVSSYFITPVVIIISTPMLLKNLGSANYGIWVLINSLINVLGISNFGLGNAFIKIGSEYESSQNNTMFNQLFSVSFTLSIILAIVFNVITLVFDTSLFPLLFGISGMDSILPVIHLVGGVVGLRIINSVISGSYMAKERYDINSKVNIAYNLITSILFTVLAFMYKDIKLLVIFLFISTVLLLLTNAFIAKKVNSSISFRLLLNKLVFLKIFNYGIYSWLQMIISALNNQADKLIIGFLLGPNALGYYAVCMQLVIKIHEVPAAAGAFLFAKFSSLYESRKITEIRGLYLKAFLYKSIFIISSSSIAFVFANPILTLWINSEFASQHMTLFRVLVIAVAIGAFGVIPNYCLNGTGFIKINTVLSLSTSISIFSLIFILVPYYGDISTGLSRLVAIPLVVFSIIFVHRKILKVKFDQEEVSAIKELLVKTPQT
ncbi:Membrane protein involved in the export of O-antigen and teichoic acid [Paenibacillus uliginis N3/975]|uniref:Membrane protein involved in the export of O-antigen and teichoic acid n=1 Tax=Paenibacillus uliginis N3/975 TaxID=1313296 RepID=A0A1X7HTE7_9BACL|nr:oligosaccharide flippase family protein [Paenibacillus uliginis]SMF92160.1 Membrane protein involved in the export of O-antigen and teichoic acid [Paenibacillus uliginis N3/975]